MPASSRGRASAASSATRSRSKARPGTTPTSTSELRRGLDARARALGFDALHVAAAEVPSDRQDGLARALVQGRHGTMRWLADTFARRRTPTAMWAEARSAILLGVNYGPDEDPLAVLARRAHAGISVYARGDDYHDVIKGRLKQLAQWLAARADGAVKVFVDTAPLMEKPLAERAGLGWQGKHTNLVSRRFGSWLLLGCILTDLELVPDPPERDFCGSCRRCLEVCPTDAFPAPYQLDARRCISYLTIEHAGPIPHALRRPMGNRVFGCDDCLAVCPWNKFARAAHEVRLVARDELRAPALADLAALDDGGFRALFRKSPVKRVGRARFLRNVLIAVGNSGEPALAAAAGAHLDAPEPVVRGAAIWALGELLPADAFATLARQRLPLERDASVRREWHLAADAA
jgi:epoxyqueuosine reductase